MVPFVTAEEQGVGTNGSFAQVPVRGTDTHNGGKLNTPLYKGVKGYKY